MSDLTLNTIFGPQYEILITEVSEPLKIAVGIGYNGNQISTGTLDVQIIALEPVGAYRAVGYDGLYTQPDSDSLSLYAGVTRMATVAGDPINVVRSGFLFESTWNWTPNAPIFITTNGVLTQTQPTAGNPVRRIGWAISATELNLDPYPIIGV